jgi:hypothetical protein
VRVNNERTVAMRITAAIAIKIITFLGIGLAAGAIWLEL